MFKIKLPWIKKNKKSTIEIEKPIVGNFKKSVYLYDVKGSYFTKFSYEYAIKEKIRLGKLLLKKLTNDLNYKNSNYNELTKRITDIKKAIEFNENLLKELNDTI